MELFFYISAFLSVYSYFVYPALLFLIPKHPTRNSGQSADSPLPFISIIIAAHNEENSIQEKVSDTLAIDYPVDRYEVLIASDCSTDRTDDIVRSIDSENVKLIRQDSRAGKEAAQKLAINTARGDIYVFTDVATRIDAGSIRTIAQHFSDDNVGAISSQDKFINEHGVIAGEGAYIKYEMWLRKLESQRAGLVGLSGSFFAARPVACNPWDEKIDSDFNVALNCARHDLLALHSDSLFGYYRDLKAKKDEYNRKVRTVVRGLTAISRNLWALNVFKQKMFSFQVWSHKVMRWLVPWFLLMVAVFTVLLFERGPVFVLAAAAQLLFYTIALAGLIFPQIRQISIVNIFSYFLEINVAIAHATILFLLGKRISTWRPSAR